MRPVPPLFLRNGPRNVEERPAAGGAEHDENGSQEVVSLWQMDVDPSVSLRLAPPRTTVSRPCECGGSRPIQFASNLGVREGSCREEGDRRLDCGAYNRGKNLAM